MMPMSDITENTANVADDIVLPVPVPAATAMQQYTTVVVPILHTLSEQVLFCDYQPPDTSPTGPKNISKIIFW